MTSGYFFQYDCLVDELQYERHMLYATAEDLLRSIFNSFKTIEPTGCLTQYDWALEDKLKLISSCTDTDEVCTMMSEPDFLSCDVIDNIPIAVKYTQLLKAKVIDLTIDTNLPYTLAMPKYVFAPWSPKYVPAPPSTPQSQYTPASPKYVPATPEPMIPTSPQYSPPASPQYVAATPEPTIALPVVTRSKKRVADRAVTRSMTKAQKISI